MAGRWLDYARLIRLPNVFTALADILLGAAIVGLTNVVWTLLALLISSACLYSAGMVLNDWFDVDRDRFERPNRPLSSGRVSLSIARILSAVLLLSGIVAAVFAGVQSALIATGLSVAIVMYDGFLKFTPAGPAGMGICRLLNVLLGSSVGPESTENWAVRLHGSLAVAVYITGVTWFARTETVRSDRRQLLSAALVIAGAFVIALAVPADAPSSQCSPLFPYLLTGYGLYLAEVVSCAWRNPEPYRVQAAVKRAILGLIVFDAVLATCFVGVYGLSIALLLVPAIALGKRVYST